MFQASSDSPSGPVEKVLQAGWLRPGKTTAISKLYGNLLPLEISADIMKDGISGPDMACATDRNNGM